MASKSRSALITQATSTLADNTSGAITPALLRVMVQDVIDSSSNLISDGSTTTYVTQTGNYTLPDYTATDGVCQDFVITGNSANTLSIPSTTVGSNFKWQNSNNTSLDNTQINNVYSCAKNGYIYYSVIKTPLQVTGDVTAPTYSTQTVTGLSTTTGTFSAKINETGYIRWMATASPTIPTKVAILAGTGAVGANFGSILMNANTVNTANLTGLTAANTYYLYSYAEDASSNQTAIQTAINFTTPAISAPIYNIQTVPSPTSTGATYSVQINQAGTVNWIITNSTTIPTTTQITAGTGAVGSNFGSLTMTANVTNSAAVITGLSASTAYYLYSFATNGTTTTGVQTAVSFTTATTTAVLQDNFNRVNQPLTGNTPTIGTNTWTGGLTIVSNQLRYLSGTNTASYDIGKSDFDLSMTVIADPNSILVFIPGGGAVFAENLAINDGATTTGGSGNSIAGDIIRIVRVGNLVSGYRNATLINTRSFTKNATTLITIQVGTSGIIDDLIVY